MPLYNAPLLPSLSQRHSFTHLCKAAHGAASSARRAQAEESRRQGRLVPPPVQGRRDRDKDNTLVRPSNETQPARSAVWSPPRTVNASRRVCGPGTPGQRSRRWATTLTFLQVGTTRTRNNSGEEAAGGGRLEEGRQRRQRAPWSRPVISQKRTDANGARSGRNVGALALLHRRSTHTIRELARRRLLYPDCLLLRAARLEWAHPRCRSSCRGD